MTAKEKALELVNKYTRLVPEDFGGMNKELAKQCAIVCVDEILNKDGYNNYYWQQVKKEIENL